MIWYNHVHFYYSVKVPRMNHQIFIYGKFATWEFLNKRFQRPLTKDPDLLPRFKRTYCQVQKERYSNLHPDETQYTRGHVISINENELKSLDDFFYSLGFKRDSVIVKTGRTVWIYYRMKGRHHSSTR